MQSKRRSRGIRQKTMIVAIQQPEHVPWLGFFNKMAHCDLFVYLDNVQFKRRYFENRNRIGTDKGVAWLTVPVESRGRFDQRIDQVKIHADGHWARKYMGTLRQTYARAPFRAEVEELVRPHIERDHADLVSLNLALIESVRDYLGIPTHTARASSMRLGALRGGDLILAICRHAGATVYVSGPDGRDYLDPSAFEQASVRVTYHDYAHPTYPQHGPGFTSHLSILDVIAHCGRAAGEIVRSGELAEALP